MVGSIGSTLIKWLSQVFRVFQNRQPQCKTQNMLLNYCISSGGLSTNVVEFIYFVFIFEISRISVHCFQLVIMKFDVKYHLYE